MVKVELKACFVNHRLGIWRICVFLYLALCVATHMTLSPGDMMDAARGFCALVTMMLVINTISTFAGFNSCTCLQWCAQCAIYLNTAMLWALLLNGMALASSLIVRKVWQSFALILTDEDKVNLVDRQKGRG